MLIESINWNANPEIFTLFGIFPIRYYGLLFASGLLISYSVIARIYKNEHIPLENLEKLTVYIFIGTIAGARLGHCLFYEPAYYLSNPLEIIKIWHGGLASHGAAIGILLALYLFSRKVKKPFLWTMDRVVIVVALAGSLIRMGNLMNSEIIGNPTTVSWAFIFERVDNIPRHPAQIYESFLRVNKALKQLSINEDRVKENMEGIRQYPTEAMVTILKGEKWKHTLRVKCIAHFQFLFLMGMAK